MSDARRADFLAGLRVLEIGDGVAGASATSLLWALGAEVTAVVDPDSVHRRGRPNIEHDDSTLPEAVGEPGAIDDLHPLTVAEVGLGERVEPGQVRFRDVANGGPQLAHPITRQRVVDARPIAACREQTGSRQRP